MKGDSTRLCTGAHGRAAKGRCVGEARLRGDRMAELRKAAGLRQSDLAAQLGTLDRRVGEWERGEQQPRPHYLVAIAAVLDVDPIELLDVDLVDPPLLALRLATGMTLRELAEASGIPFSSYRRFELGVGRAAPAKDVVDALAAALGVTPQQVQRAAACSRAERLARA